MDNGSSYETVTDRNGLARVAGKCGEWVSVVVSKEGCYPSQDEIRFNGLKKRGIFGSYVWEPYGEKRVMVLKKICNLGKTRIFPDSLRRCKIPEFNTWIGFDFKCADWIAPYGIRTL